MKLVTTCGWEDVPHLSKEECAAILKSYPAYQRKARSTGAPTLGAGAIYPFEEETFAIDPIPIPEHWPRGFALDVGWNKTAALWGAFDREQDMLYLWSEHYRGEAEPAVHAHSILRRGEWIPGRIDPAARGRGQADGKKLMNTYRDDYHLPITEASNAVEAGIFQVYVLFSESRIKVFKQLRNFFSELSLYRRDEKGNVVKDYDHLMDCLRYMVIDGFDWMATEPQQRYQERRDYGWQV